MSRHTYFISFVFLISWFFVPTISYAVGSPIGETCTVDAQCITADCEDSSLSGWNNDYCVCQTAVHCAKAYGGDANDWECSDTNASSLAHELHYCKNKTTNKIYDPVNEKGATNPFLLGEQCSDNAECITGDCEDSDLSGDDDFCVCQSAAHCAEAYGGSPTDWTCSDDNENQHNDLHYCELKSTGKQLNPSKPEGKAQGINPQNNVITVNTDVPLPLLDEIKLTIEKPQPKINIPGLNFSEVDLEAMVTEEGGSTWLNIPFLGEYLSAIYKYGVIVISIFGVLGLMAGGVMWMMSGGTADGKTRAIKYIKNSIIGILLAVTSYTLLYMINPNLVEFQNLKILWVKGEQLPEAEENTYADFNSSEFTGSYEGADAEIAKKATDLSQIQASSFMKTDINGKYSDGWAIWNNMSETEKKEVLPYLYIQILPKCPEDHLVKATGIPGWSNKKVHPAVLPAFKKAYEMADDLGFQMVPGTLHRAAKVMVPLWNTGIVARKTQGKKSWKKNEGIIAVPSCMTGHSMGAAVDINLKDKTTNKYVLKASADKKTKTQTSYDQKFLTDPYMILLEEIMNRNGWVRLCTEPWHFEYGVTPRVKAWESKDNKKSRCWNKYNSFDKPIPQNMKDKINKIVGKNIY